MLALPSVTEEESWVVSVNGGNSLHPAEPGLAFTKPALSDNETEGECNTARPTWESAQDSSSGGSSSEVSHRASLRVSSPELCLIVAPREVTDYMMPTLKVISTSLNPRMCTCHLTPTSVTQGIDA